LQQQGNEEPTGSSLPDDDDDPRQAAGDAPVRREGGAPPPSPAQAPTPANPPASESTRSGTLVPATAVDATVPIRIPHDIVVLNAATGEALDPPVRATSDSQGQFLLPIHPTDVDLALHVEGQGDASAGNATFDTVVLGFGAHDPLVRVWAAGTASIPQQVAGFSARQDRAQLRGTVYVTRAGRRVGVVGCAKLLLDGATGLAIDSDQRYVSANGLPTTPGTLAATEPARGSFYFGNIAKGMHTLRVSVDDGKTFIATRRFVVPFSRAEATSAYKDMIVQLAIDIEGSNPTPANCNL
jgi:hypothetical protein